MNDLISRRAAIKAIDDLPNCYNGYSDTYDKAYIIGVLEELPTIEPKKVVEDYCRPRNLMMVAAEDFHRFDVPDRKVGEWMPYEFGDYHWHKCSVCGKADKYIDTIIRGYALGTNDIQKNDLESVRNYCPNCGAKMERSEDEF